MHLWNRQILNKINPIHALSQVIAAYYLFCLTWAYLSAWKLNLFFDSPAVAPTWYLYVIVGLSAVSFFLLPKNDFALGHFNLSKSLWWTIFAAFISTLLFRFIFVHHTGLWLDELAELDLSTKYWPIIACAGQTQPPLTCVLTTIGIKYFGYSEFAGRFHVIVASALASAFFVLSLWRIVRSKFFLFLYIIALIVPANVIQYGYEVRPISLAIMHTLMLMAWLDFLLTKKTTRFDLFYFTSSGVLLLLSVGLQSAFAMAGLFLALFLMSLFLKTKRYLGLLFSVFIAISIYFPLQLYIFKQTHLSVLPGASLAPIHVFFTYLKQESWSYFISQSGTFGYLFVALIAIIGVIVATFRRILMPSQKEVLERYFIYALTTMFFYLLLPAYFKAYIPFGNLQSRYTLIGWPLVLLSVASGVQFVLGFNFKTLRLPIHAFVFLLIAGVFSLNFVQDIYGWYLPSSYTFTHLEKRMELREFYNWLKTSTTADDVVFRACLRTETEFCSLNLTYPGAAVYYRDAKNSARLRPTDIPFEMYKFLSGKEEFHRMIVFFESYEVNKIQLDGTYIANLKNTEYLQVHEIPVLIFSGDRKTVIKNWRAFIENVEQRNPGHNLDTPEYLLQLALIDKDRNSFVKYRELWRDIGARTNNRIPSLEAYDRLMEEKLSEKLGEQNE
jgi:hypothetical protein